MPYDPDPEESCSSPESRLARSERLEGADLGRLLYRGKSGWSPSCCRRSRCSCGAPRELPDRLPGDLVALVGHTQLVEAVMLSLDGRTLASCAGFDQTVRLWVAARLDDERPAGTEILSHSSVVFALAFSPDGSRLVAVGDHFVTIWSCDRDRTGGRLNESRRVVSQRGLLAGWPHPGPGRRGRRDPALGDAGGPRADGPEGPCDRHRAERGLLSRRQATGPRRARTAAVILLGRDPIEGAAGPHRAGPHAHPDGGVLAGRPDDRRGRSGLPGDGCPALRRGNGRDPDSSGRSTPRGGINALAFSADGRTLHDGRCRPSPPALGSRDGEGLRQHQAGPLAEVRCLLARRPMAGLAATRGRDRQVAGPETSHAGPRRGSSPDRTGGSQGNLIGTTPLPAGSGAAYTRRQGQGRGFCAVGPAGRTLLIVAGWGEESPMRILVVSDLHGDLDSARRACDRVKPRAILSCGDWGKRSRSEVGRGRVRGPALTSDRLRRYDLR